jgi:hypothetical protein
VTKFHKGRLKISYDPRNDITSTNPAENTVYTEILDIGEKDDVTFTIPYHQDLGWLKTDDSFSTNWTPGNTLAPRIGTDNGVLTVRVLNTLTAPAAGSVNLLFFVTGGDNFEFANPKGANVITNSVPTPFALQGEELTDVVSESIVIGTPSQWSQNDTVRILVRQFCLSGLYYIVLQWLSIRLLMQSLTEFIISVIVRSCECLPGQGTTLQLGWMRPKLLLLQVLPSSQPYMQIICRTLLECFLGTEVVSIMRLRPLGTISILWMMLRFSVLREPQTTFGDHSLYQRRPRLLPQLWGSVLRR